ncbi:cobalamin-binding protein [bacterium]|nr:cobalamin-binding protein [bacterium]
MRFKMFFMLVAVFFFITTHTSAEHRFVKDGVGRTVRVPVNPKRVVSLAPSVTEIIYELRQGHRLKGATRFSDFPPEADRLPKVGSYIHLDLERIVSLKPDLCIAIKDGNPIEEIKRLESLNVSVFAINSIGFSTLMESIRSIGSLLDSSRQADVLIGDLTRRIEIVKERVADADKRPGVFFQIGITPIVSAGSDTFIHELIELAGGRNLARGATSYPRYSREQVLLLAPDVIIITSMSRNKAFIKSKKAWNSWPQLPAVRNKSVFIVDSNLFDRPTSRLVSGLEILASLLHPEQFKKGKLEK